MGAFRDTVRSFLRIAIALAIVLLAMTVKEANAWTASSRQEDASDQRDSQGEAIESMLHSLALYVLAAEILVYLRDGAGDTSSLADRYGNHPGWIPALGRATYDPEDEVLYVPLGQCIWKIFSGKEGALEFSLLHPRDKQLNESDKWKLVFHLFGLANKADRRKDSVKAIQNAALAEDILFPHRAYAGRVTDKARNCFSKPLRDLDQSL